MMEKLKDWLALRIYSGALMVLPVKDKVSVMRNVDRNITFPCMRSTDPYELGSACKLLAINSKTFSRIAAKELKN